MRVQTVVVAAALLACAAPQSARSRPIEAPSRRGPYTLEVVDEGGGVLPTFEHGGRTYVLGTLGQRYLVRVRNHSARRIEAVVSVDGRDVVDGRPASLEKRGYLVEPHGEVAIDGYRLSDASVAAFRFSSVPRSYAARTGDARDVGVIGVAVFAERAPRRERPFQKRPGPDGWDPSREAPGSGDAGPQAAPERADAPAEAPEARGPQASQAPSASRGEARAARPGLGTEFGEVHASHVREVPFVRASSRPQAVLTVRYDDRRGLVALGIDVDRRYAARDDAWLRETAEPFRGSGYAEPPPGWGRW